MTEERALTTSATISPEIMEHVVIGGDLSKLTPVERVQFYGRVCESLRLNPLTQPFSYLNLQGKLTLYAKRDATDQLRKLHNISISIVGRERIEDVYVVTARATTPEGRSDESTGAVAIANLRGDALANGLMKAETKAKRRVTLSIVGLGWMDETEIETIPNARPVNVDADGVIVTEAKQAQTKQPDYAIMPLDELAKLWFAGKKGRDATLATWLHDKGLASVLDASATDQENWRAHMIKGLAS